MKVVTLVLFVISGVGCRSSPADIFVVYSSGVGRTEATVVSVLDTRDSTYTCGWASGPKGTVRLPLTPTELTEIADSARTTGFFKQPSKIDKSDCGVVFSKGDYTLRYYALRIKHGRRNHTVHWTSTCEPESLRRLRVLVEGMIRSKEEFKKLPTPGPGYM